jgi:HEAT repeat protein
MPLFAAPNIEKLKARRDVEDLIRAIHYRDNWRVSLAAVRALGEIGDARAAAPLINELNSDYWGMRLAAAEALGDLGNKRAIEPLIGLLMLRQKRATTPPGTTGTGAWK